MIIIKGFCIIYPLLINGLKILTILYSEIGHLLAPHGAQAVIAFSYSTTTTVLLLYFPNILLKPLKTNV